MTDGNTYAISKYLNDQEDWDALQEVTAELEQAEERIEELEAKLAKAVEAEREACANVVRHFHEKGQVTKPEDIIHRTTLAELKGQDDE